MPSKQAPHGQDGNAGEFAPNLTIVVAHDAQRGIGFENELPWKIPEDLAHFKRVTLGKPIIMGRKTFDSIGQPLPGRLNIVITRQTLWPRAGVKVAHSLKEAIALAGGPASIIGGAQIFEEAISLCDQMIITEVAGEFGCDTFFPKFDLDEWCQVDRQVQRTAAGAELAFVTYKRRHAGSASAPAIETASAAPAAPPAP